MLRVAEKVKRSLNERDANVQAVVGVFQLLGQLLSLNTDLPKPGPQLVFRPSGIAGEVEQVVFLTVEPAQMFCDLMAEQLGSHRLIVEGLVQFPSHRRRELLGEADAPVVARNCVLDRVYRDVAAITRSVLFPTAEEVEVFAASTPHRSLQQKTTVTSILLALPAPDGALQVVRMLTKTLAGGRPRFEDCLDALKQFFTDERFMSPLVHLALVRHDADVVRVAEHRLNLGRRHFAGGIAPWPGNQSSVCEHGLEAFDGVLAGDVEIERQPDEGCALRIKGNSADLATFEPLDDVQVAQWSSAKRPALAGLLAHLVADVCPILG